VIHLKGQAVAETYERIGERGAFYALTADKRAADDSGSLILLILGSRRTTDESYHRQSRDPQLLPRHVSS
jgi:hypothetical protein